MRSLYIFLGLVCSNILTAAPSKGVDQFSVEEMPIGAEVTVPPTARTIVPMGAKISLSSTDNPQTIRIVSIGDGSTFAAPFRLSIFDAHQDRVKYVLVGPNEPFLYSFNGLSTIRVEPTLEKSKSAGAHGIRMQIESDRAVTVSR